MSRDWSGHGWTEKDAVDYYPSYAEGKKKEPVWGDYDRWRCFDFWHGSIRLYCYLRMPQTERLTRGGLFPLLLFLHSASYDPVSDLFPLGDAWLDGAISEPMFVLCPLCPDEFYWLIRGNSWTEEGGEWIIDSRGFALFEGPAATEMAEALVELLKQVARDLPVNLGRVFLSGASMGGHACWDLAARHPGLFCALAPVASHYKVSEMAFAAQRLYSMPTWAFHGHDDQCCNFDEAQELVRKLGRKAGLTEYRRKEGDELSVHNSAAIVAYVDHGPALMRWFLRQPPSRGQYSR